MIAKLQIQTALYKGKTILKNAFCSQPFKLADITEDRSEKTLRLMMMTSSPGILDGDEYNIQIEVEEDCSVELETQSYQRLFNMKEGASQVMEIKMAKRSSFIFLPHPSVPHESSVFTAKNKIYLSEGCSLIWGEVLTSGRKLSGENFLMSKYHSLTEIFLDGKLIVKENLLMAPKTIDVTTIGQLEGYTHQASFIYINEAFLINPTIEKINELLAGEKEICFGVSALQVNGIIVRLLGYKGEQLYYCLKKIASFFSQNKLLSKPVAYAK